MHLVGLKNKILENITEPLQLEDCQDVIVRNPQISGGFHNIEMLNCQNCLIEGGFLTDPIPVEKNKNDYASHNILFNNCKGCLAVGVRCHSKKPRGDSINCYQSDLCKIINCIISGKFCKMATACILGDGGSGDYNQIKNLKILSKGARIGIVGGKMNSVVDTKTTGPIEITGQYYENSRILKPTLIRVIAPELYIHTPTVSGLVQKNCKFKVINKG